MKILLLMGSVLFGLVACGPVSNEQPTTSPPATETIPPRPTRPTPTAVVEAYPPPGPTQDPTLYPPPLAPTAVPRPTLYPAGTVPGADAEVQFVEATETAPNVWTITVTVAHPDEGWDHYADGWDVVLPDNTVLKVDSADDFTRVLAHPHENEQPFTRSQTGLVIPQGTTIIYVRAHDNVHGYGNPVLVDLTTSEGEKYRVERLAE